MFIQGQYQFSFTLIRRDCVSFRKTKQPFLRQTTQILILCVFVYTDRIAVETKGKSTVMERQNVPSSDRREQDV